ncbi:HD-GYP domain-containing protein [Defluviitalea phaphyphila]|uniref:HD-GYP domain-containing protein n=1 Tax=Defluviitalea phaphyphila TaxID=1473580 RepID=UPI0007312A97|nr:HD-GYP domain-containing protein [Defluviitalea phaphyphila]
MLKEELDCLLDEISLISQYLKEDKNKKNFLIEGTYTGSIKILKNKLNNILSMLYEKELQLEEDEMEIIKYTKQLKCKNKELFNRQSEIEAAHSQLKAYTEEIERINLELNKKVEELKNLFQFSQEVTSIFDKYELLKFGLKDIASFTNSSFGLVLISTKSNYFKLIDVYYKNNSIHSIIYPLFKRFINKEGYLRHKLSINDVYIYSRIEEKINLHKVIKSKLNKEISSLAIIPIFNNKKEIIAIIILLSEYFDENEKYLFSCYSNVLGIALENAKLYQDINKMFVDTIKVLANAIEVKDTYTKGHVDRVTEYCVEIAKKMNFSNNQLEKIKIAAVLHDIGKIGIPDDILNKPDKLSKDEFKVVKLHPLKGYEIIKDIPALKDISIYVKQHHERIDGKGYPEGLKDNQITLEAKIIAVADAFDAMTSDRPYRKGMDFIEAANILVENQGSQFDEYVVNIFLEYLKENKNITIKA